MFKGYEKNDKAQDTHADLETVILPGYIGESEQPVL
jgi:hypothetical protein